MAPVRWSFLVPILLFTAGMGLLLWIAFYGLRQPLEPAHGIMLIWFAAITTALHLWQEHSMATDPKGFVRRFMGGMSLKMLLSLGVLVVLVVRAPKEAVLSSTIAFAVLYLAFLAFSTVRLTALSRKLPKA
jgi:branched-subunit amino acid transport protein AzlD